MASDLPPSVADAVRTFQTQVAKVASAAVPDRALHVELIRDASAAVHKAYAAHPPIANGYFSMTRALDVLWPTIDMLATHWEVSEFNRRAHLVMLLGVVWLVAQAKNPPASEFLPTDEIFGAEPATVGRIALLVVFLPPERFATVLESLPSLAEHEPTKLCVLEVAMRLIRSTGNPVMDATRAEWEGNAHANLSLLLDETPLGMDDLDRVFRLLPSVALYQVDEEEDDLAKGGGFHANVISRLSEMLDDEIEADEQLHAMSDDDQFTAEVVRRRLAAKARTFTQLMETSDIAQLLRTCNEDALAWVFDACLSTREPHLVRKLELQQRDLAPAHRTPHLLQFATHTFANLAKMLVSSNSQAFMAHVLAQGEPPAPVDPFDFPRAFALLLFERCRWVHYASTNARQAEPAPLPTEAMRASSDALRSHLPGDLGAIVLDMVFDETFADAPRELGAILRRQWAATDMSD